LSRNEYAILPDRLFPHFMGKPEFAASAAGASGTPLLNSISGFHGYPYPE
jgi:hypothetical protein